MKEKSHTLAEWCRKSDNGEIKDETPLVKLEDVENKIEELNANWAERLENALKEERQQ